METSKYQIKTFASQQPITPLFSEVLSRVPYVLYGANNLYPQELIDKYNNSSIHKAIIISKAMQTCGDGLSCFKEPMATIRLVNGNETIDEVFRKCALDLVLFGGYAINVVKSKGNSIAELYHIDFSRIRCGKINPDTDKIETYFYSPDWTQVKSHKKEFQPVEYPAFNMNDKSPSQVLYYQPYSPNTSYYSTPSYSGALSSIEIDIQIKEHHSNNLKNNFAPGLWVEYCNGIPSEEEIRVLTRGLEEQYGGTQNSGRPIISFSESKELAPIITTIPAGTNDGYYVAIYSDIIRSILSGHQVSCPELYGISTPGALGVSKQMISDASQFMYKTVIIPLQNQMLPTFNKLMSIKMDVPVQFEVKPLVIFDTTVDNPLPIQEK